MVKPTIFWWEGSPPRAENLHKAVYDFGFLKYRLKQAGFAWIVQVPIEYTESYIHNGEDMLVRAYK